MKTMFSLERKSTIKIFSTGFTLIEVIIYIAILGLVVSAFTVFAINASDIRTRIKIEQEVNANARFVLDFIKQKVIEADEIVEEESDFGVNFADALDNSALTLCIDASIGCSNSDNWFTFKIAESPSHENARGIVFKDRSAPIPTNGLITSNEARVIHLSFQLTHDTAGKQNLRVNLRMGNVYDIMNPLYSYTQFFHTTINVR